jgi:hypothetical protein
VSRGPGYSLTAVLGLPPEKDPSEERAIAGAQRAARDAIFERCALGVVAAIADDYRVSTFEDDNARVIVSYSLEGQAVESQEMPISRFGAFVADAPAAQIHTVRPSLPPPTPLAAYGIGHCDRFQAAVWDRRGAATLLMLRPKLLGHFTTRTPSGSRLRDAINAVNALADAIVTTRPADGAAVAAGAAWAVLDDEAAEPVTPGPPVGNWFVTEAWPPWRPIAWGGNPPLEGDSRFGRIKEAITTDVSGVAYFRTKPGYAGSRERQLPLFDDAVPIGHLGRAWSDAAKKERTRRGVNLARKTYTLDEYRALSLDALLVLNLIEYGRIGWQHEVSTGTLTQRFVKRNRGHRQLWLADPTGDTAAGLMSATLSLHVAALRWTTAGMSFDRPFANADEVRGVPVAALWTPRCPICGDPVRWETTAGEVLLDRLLEVGLSERQAVCLLNVQAGWTAEEIHEVLGIARSTVAAHLSAARKILQKNLRAD